MEVWNGHCAAHGDGVFFFKARSDEAGVVITCSICAYQNAMRDLREAEAREAEALDEAQLAIQACKQAKGESNKGEGKNEGKGRSKGKYPWPYEANEDS